MQTIFLLWREVLCYSDRETAAWDVKLAIEFKDLQRRIVSSIVTSCDASIKLVQNELSKWTAEEWAWIKHGRRSQNVVCTADSCVLGLCHKVNYLSESLLFWKSIWLFILCLEILKLLELFYFIRKKIQMNFCTIIYHLYFF